MVVPERHDEGHALVHSRADGGEAALLLEGVLVAEGFLLCSAECLIDGVTGDAGNGGHGVWDGLAVLDVEALDLGEWASDELGDYGEFLAGVDCFALAVEGRVSHAVAVEVASIRIAITSIASRGVSATAGIAIALMLRNSLA